MNPREKLLAIIVGCLLAVGAMVYGTDWMLDKFRQRRNTLSALEGQIAEQERIRGIGHRANQRIAAYRSRSLPGDQDRAHGLYQDWLLSLLADAGLADRSVTAQPATPQPDVYHQLNFQAAGRGTLDQMTRLLHRFYSADHLHRIKHLTLKPIRDTKQIDLNMRVEALSVSGAQDRELLETRPSERLAMNDLSDYRRSVVHRSLFAPANRSPSISRIAQQNVPRGQTLSLQISAKDPDPLDKLKYQLADGAPDGARLDSNSGQLRWTPPQMGTYDVTVEVTDDGFPAQVARATFKIEVVEPQPVATWSREDAEYTQVTGIVEGQQRLLWLHHRTSGKRFRLEVGDEFQAGKLKGTVKQINRRDALLVIGQRVLRVVLGKSIEQGEEIGDSEPKEVALPSKQA